jgi:hypothetical protein
VVLKFDEVVKRSSLDVTGITLQKTANGSSASYTLTNGTSSDTDGTALSIVLPKVDVDAMKSLGICINQGSCFVSLSQVTVTDMFNSQLVTVPTSNATQATLVVPDVTAPQFVAAVLLNYDTETLTLSFDEPVVAGALDASAVRLLDSAEEDSDTSFLNLTNGTSVSGVNSTVVMRLSVADINALKVERFETRLCNKRSQCFVSLGSAFVTDASGVALASASASALNVEVDRDTTSPRVVAVAVNMNVGEVVITFDEPVRDATTRLQAITLHNRATLAGSTRSLSLSAKSGGTDNNGVQVTLTMQASDVLALKVDFDLCTSIANCFANVTSNAAEDLIENAVAATVTGLTTFVADSVAPTFDQLVEANPNSGALTLQFSEPMSLNIEPTQITLQSRATNTSASVFVQYTLQKTPASVSYLATATDKKTVVVTMHEDDRNAMNVLSASSPTLFTSRSDTFVLLGNASFVDAANVSLVSTGVGLQAATFENRDNAELVQYDLNMTSGELSLSFSSAIDASSITGVGGGSLTLQSGQGSTGVEVFPFSDGTTQSSDGATIVMKINSVDLDAIKANRQLATNKSDTWLVMGASAFQDTYGPPVSG